MEKVQVKSAVIKVDGRIWEDNYHFLAYKQYLDTNPDSQEYPTFEGFRLNDNTIIDRNECLERFGFNCF